MSWLEALSSREKLMKKEKIHVCGEGWRNIVSQCCNYKRNSWPIWGCWKESLMMVKLINSCTQVIKYLRGIRSWAEDL